MALASAVKINKTDPICRGIRRNEFFNAIKGLVCWLNMPNHAVYRIYGGCDCKFNSIRALFVSAHTRELVSQEGSGDFIQASVGRQIIFKSG